MKISHRRATRTRTKTRVDVTRILKLPRRKSPGNESNGNFHRVVHDRRLCDAMLYVRTITRYFSRVRIVLLCGERCERCIAKKKGTICNVL